MSDVEAAVRTCLVDDHTGFLQTVATCADRTADEWRRPPSDGRVVADALEDRLAAAGVVDRCPGVLRDAAAAVGHQLAADPVPALPYVAVTSVGLVLRASLPSGRLVVTVEAFAIEHGKPGDPPRYVRRDADVTSAVAVTFRPR